MCGSKTAIFLLASGLVLLLAWLFNPFNPHPPHPSPPDYSYDTEIKFNLDELRTPTNHSEIVDVVQDALKNNRKIRVLAGGHSWSEIAQTQDIMISLHKYTGLVSVDKAALTATIRAGTTLRDISLLLDKEGLAMINLGSVAAQSLGGAVSTATHGTGLEVGNLASLITKVKFVAGTGKTEILSETDANSENFRATVVSIGLYGVLSEITIRVAPAFNLNEVRSPRTLTHCLENLNALVEGHQFVKFWVEFYNDFCAVYQTQRTKETVGGNYGLLESFLPYYSFAIITRITYLVPFLTGFMMKAVNNFGLGRVTRRVDKSYLIFNNFFELPIHQESEIIVPYNDSVELIQTIRDVVLNNSFPVNYITEVRFIKGDDNYLSPQYDMPDGSCAVTLTIYATKERAEAYFDAVYEATRKLNGRIHWGKYFSHADHTAFRKWFPKFDDFMALREKYDSKKVFVNKFIEQKFGFGS